MAAKQNLKCPECHKTFFKSNDSICCDSCDNWFHLRCTDLSTKVFIQLCNAPTSSFVCNYCTNYKCGKCSHPVFNNNNALCCDNRICDTWYHLKCTIVSLQTYNNFKIGSSDTWYCYKCYVFPFLHLSETLFTDYSSFSEYTGQTNAQLCNQNFNNTCSVCSRKINKICKGLPCTLCLSFIHRKCSGISLYDLNNQPKESFEHWGCPSCYCDIYPFYNEVVGRLSYLTWVSQLIANGNISRRAHGF